jgi:hypothetical protein
MVTIAAGDNPRPLSPGEQRRLRQQLLEAPSLEEADAKLADTATQVRDLVTERVPGYQWQLDHQDNRSATSICYHEFEGTGALSLDGPWWIGPEIPAEKWPELSAGIGRIIRSTGLIRTNPKPARTTTATPATSSTEAAERYGAIRSDDLGNTLTFLIRPGLGELSTLLTYDTPCLMPQAVKDTWLSGQTPDPTARDYSPLPVAPLPIYSSTPTSAPTVRESGG